MQPALTRPPLPKLAWLAAAIALLNAAYLIFAALSAQTFIALPLALIPLVAAIGILRRNIWSARGFALYQLCGIVLVLFLGVRTTLTSADTATLIATASLTLLLAALFFLASRSLARAQGKLGRPQLWIAVSVFIVFPLFFLQAFSIPSASMEDTLLVGDSVLVQRWPKPVVARGDAIVFPYPLDPHEDHIKRIVGVAGDRLRIANKVLYRNGAPVIEPYARHKTTYIDAYRDNFPSQPNTPLQPPAQDMLTSHVVNGEVVVPAGKYFVMGDNRDNSLDSRYFGFVDAATVLGKPILIYNSIDRPISDTTLVPQQRGRVRWNRLFRIVRLEAQPWRTHSCEPGSVRRFGNGVRHPSQSGQKTGLPDKWSARTSSGGQWNETPLHVRLPEINPPRFHHRSTVMRLGPQAEGDTPEPLRGSTFRHLRGTAL